MTKMSKQIISTRVIGRKKSGENDILSQSVQLLSHSTIYQKYL